MPVWDQILGVSWKASEKHIFVIRITITLQLRQSLWILVSDMFSGCTFVTDGQKSTVLQTINDSAGLKYEVCKAVKTKNICDL